MNTKKFFTTAALALSLTALPVLASPGDRGDGRDMRHNDNQWSASQRAQANRYFRQYDVNGDGFISRREFPGDRAMFRTFDLNRDGRISRAEIERVLPNRQAAEGIARGYDRNGDGVITRREFGGTDQAFRQLDRNGDGVITAADQNGTYNNGNYNNGNGRGRNRY